MGGGRRTFGPLLDGAELLYKLREEAEARDEGEEAEAHGQRRHWRQPSVAVAPALCVYVKGKRSRHPNEFSFAPNKNEGGGQERSAIASFFEL